MLVQHLLRDRQLLRLAIHRYVRACALLVSHGAVSLVDHGFTTTAKL